MLDTGFNTRQLEPNFLPEDKKPKAPRRRRKFCSGFLVILIILITGLTFIIGRANNNFFVGVKNGFIIRQLQHLFTGNKDELRGESEDRVNFLFLGIGGPGHDGPYLTDTIILASLKPSTGEAAMISVPRDLIVPSDYGYVKINSIYALSQSKGIDYAFQYTKDVVGKTFAQPIHYLGVVDFNGFVKMIDDVGGVKVDVERSFTDYQFPTDNYLMQAVSFKAGEQKMDGLTALRFARSRHGNNGEGSDFARSKRQQKIIMAVKEKITSFNTLFNPRKITRLYDLLNEYTKTDLEPWEAVKLIHMTRDIDPASIYNFVLDDSPGGYLYSGISSVNGAYILQPVSGDYGQLQELAANIFNHSHMDKEGAQILVQNGTSVPNIASTMAGNLGRFGLSVVGNTNAAKQNYLTTELYDYSNGRKPLTGTFLESWFGVKASTNIPLSLLGYNMVRQLEIKDSQGQYPQLDFLVILGQDISQGPAAEIIRTLTPEELKSTTTDDFLDLPLLEDPLPQ